MGTIFIILSITAFKLMVEKSTLNYFEMHKKDITNLIIPFIAKKLSNWFFLFHELILNQLK